MVTIDNPVSAAHPGTRMGVLVMRHVDAAAPLDLTTAAEAMEEIRRKYGHLSRPELKAANPVRAYVAYYKAFGYSYHLLSQLESILTGKRTVGTKSGLLQAMFLTELESMLLTAGHDLDKLPYPLRLRVTGGGESYRSIAGKDVLTVKNDLMVCSGDSIISSILRGPDDGSRITGATKNTLFTLYAPAGIAPDYIEGTLKALQARIQSFSPGADTGILHVCECP